MFDILFPRGHPVVIEESAYLRLGKAHAGGKADILGADGVDGEVIYTRKYAFLADAKAPGENGFLRNGRS